MENEALQDNLPEETPLLSDPDGGSGYPDTPLPDMQEEDLPKQGIGLGPWLAAMVIVLAVSATALFAVGNCRLVWAVLKGDLLMLQKKAYSAYDQYDAAIALAAELDENVTAVFPADFSAGGKPLFSAGSYASSKQVLIMNQVAGPWQTLSQYENFYPYPDNNPPPHRLKKIAAHSAALLKIYDKVYAEYQNAAVLSDGSVAADVLTAIETVRTADTDESHGVYYDVLALEMMASEPSMQEEAKALASELRRNPAYEFWMTEPYEYDIAIRENDYEAVIALGEAREARNREDSAAAEYVARAYYLSGEPTEAYQTALALLDEADVSSRDAGKLLLAELYNRDGKYAEALKYCEEVIAVADISMMAGCTSKAITLFLSGETEESLRYAKEIYSGYADQIDGSFLYACLAIAAEGKDAEFYDEVASYIDPPAAIAEIKDGKRTVQSIYADGWGTVSDAETVTAIEAEGGETE
ncbi:MAG: hypothetical protein LBR73_05400 [Oscillospiraceae bacterium]|jgi:hypothetical protein|nr:hypothetical protein [Oscillospiraceae bacterium]